MSVLEATSCAHCSSICCIRLLVPCAGSTRPCTVSFEDTSGIRHSIEVVAESLYEAVILAIAEFSCCDLMDHAAPGPGTTISVEVKSPSTRHEVPLGRVRDWLNGVTKSPKERATKDRLRALME